MRFYPDAKLEAAVIEIAATHTSSKQSAPRIQKLLPFEIRPAHGSQSAHTSKPGTFGV